MKESVALTPQLQQRTLRTVEPPDGGVSCWVSYFIISGRLMRSMIPSIYPAALPNNHCLPALGVGLTLQLSRWVEPDSAQDQSALTACLAGPLPIADSAQCPEKLMNGC